MPTALSLRTPTPILVDQPDGWVKLFDTNSSFIAVGGKNVTEVLSKNAVYQVRLQATIGGVLTHSVALRCTADDSAVVINLVAQLGAIPDDTIGVYVASALEKISIRGWDLVTDVVGGDTLPGSGDFPSVDFARNTSPTVVQSLGDTQAILVKTKPTGKILHSVTAYHNNPANPNTWVKVGTIANPVIYANFLVSGSNRYHIVCSQFADTELLVTTDPFSASLAGSVTLIFNFYNT